MQTLVVKVVVVERESGSAQRFQAAGVFPLYVMLLRSSQA
jgi:hypothetical protein